MGDIAVFKATDHMDNGIGGADVAQKFVAQAFTLGSALHKTCDVHKLNHSRGDLLGLMKLCQPVKPFIGNGNHTHIGVDGAECIVVGRDTGIGDGIKQSGFAHIGQTNDT